MIQCHSRLKFHLLFRLVTFQDSVHQIQTHFHLFDIVPNVLLAILVNLAVLIILNSLVHLINLDVLRYTRPTYTLIPAIDLLLLIQLLLTSIGNLIPGFLISAALSRPWDGYVLIDTTLFSVIISLFCFYLISSYV